jgi:hypothetical protein
MNYLKWWELYISEDEEINAYLKVEALIRERLKENETKQVEVRKRPTTYEEHEQADWDWWELEKENRILKSLLGEED